MRALAALSAVMMLGCAPGNGKLAARNGNLEMTISNGSSSSSVIVRLQNVGRDDVIFFTPTMNVNLGLRKGEGLASPRVISHPATSEDGLRKYRPGEFFEAEFDLRNQIDVERSSIGLHRCTLRYHGQDINYSAENHGWRLRSTVGRIESPAFYILIGLGGVVEVIL